VRATFFAARCDLLFELAERCLDALAAFTAAAAREALRVSDRRAVALAGACVVCAALFREFAADCALLGRLVGLGIQGDFGIKGECAVPPRLRGAELERCKKELGEAALTAGASPRFNPRLCVRPKPPPGTPTRAGEKGGVCTLASIGYVDRGDRKLWRRKLSAHLASESLATCSLP